MNQTFWIEEIPSQATIARAFTHKLKVSINHKISKTWSELKKKSSGVEFRTVWLNSWKISYLMYHWRKSLLVAGVVTKFGSHENSLGSADAGTKVRNTSKTSWEFSPKQQHYTKLLASSEAHFWNSEKLRKSSGSLYLQRIKPTVKDFPLEWIPFYS